MEVLKFADKTFFRKESKIQTLPIDKIRPNPYQTRKYFNFNALEELAASIKKCGLLQPITVRKVGSVYYELITGERRLRACEIAGYTTISALVLHINDSQSALLSMIENLQRQDLNFLEEAEGYQNMMQDYHMTLEELANNLSKSQSSIANKIRLLIGTFRPYCSKRINSKTNRRISGRNHGTNVSAKTKAYPKRKKIY